MKANRWAGSVGLGRIALAVVSIALASSCERETPSIGDVGSSAPTASPTTVDEREEDAILLVEQLEELHPDLFHSISPARFRQAADRFVARASELSFEEFFVEASRIVALPTLAGQDGHTGLFTMHAGVPLHALPLRLYDFTDGLFVVDAPPPHRDLIGAEVTGIGDETIKVIRRKIYPLITRDNAPTLKARFPPTVITSEILEGTGITAGGNARVGFDQDGRSFVRSIEPIPIEHYLAWAGSFHRILALPPDPAVLYLSRTNAPQWSRFLADSGTLYLQYNEVEYPDVLIDAIEKYRRRVLERVVVDIRHNGGGDNTQYAELISALQHPKIDRPGKLFLIAGRSTFSAAGNFAGELLHETSALLVGEPPGGSPNQFGDTQIIELPNSNISVHVAAYFVEVVPGVNKSEIQPDIPASLSSADYFTHRDPAMEAILSR